MDDLPTKATLLFKLRDPADSATWDEFVELYTPLISRYCASRGVATGDIADVTQDTMLRVAKAIRSFEYDPARGKFRSWLFRVTYSSLARHFEKKNRQPDSLGHSAMQRLLDKTPSEEAETDWDLNYRRQMFQWASAKVKPEFEEKTWNAFWRTAVESEPGASVGEVLGMSPGAVYVAKSRVIARLRERVASVTGDLELPQLSG